MGALKIKGEMIMTEVFTLQEVLAMCKEETYGFFTCFEIGEGELLLKRGDTFVKVSHLQTRGGDPRCAFEVGRQMGDTSLLLVILDRGDVLPADEAMVFVIR